MASSVHLCIPYALEPHIPCQRFPSDYRRPSWCRRVSHNDHRDSARTRSTRLCAQKIRTSRRTLRHGARVAVSPTTLRARRICGDTVRGLVLQDEETQGRRARVGRFVLLVREGAFGERDIAGVGVGEGARAWSTGRRGET